MFNMQTAEHCFMFIQSLYIYIKDIAYFLGPLRIHTPREKPIRRSLHKMCAPHMDRCLGNY